jgi:hypothetical protein
MQSIGNRFNRQKTGVIVTVIRITPKLINIIVDMCNRHKNLAIGITITIV